MPVDFLSDEQRRRYGRYCEEPSLLELGQYFYFDDSDRILISKRRGDHNRLGFALQLGTVRFLGTFLSTPTDVPPGVVAHIAQELHIANVDCLSRYAERLQTHREHAEEIRRHYDYKNFMDIIEYSDFIGWLETRAWLNPERPSVLFDLAVTRLIHRRVLLPGASVLARLVSSIRSRTSTRLWTGLASLVNSVQRQCLENLLNVPEGDRISELDRLRRSPVRVSGPALVAALERVRDLGAIGVSNIDLSAFPTSRLNALARYAAIASTQTIARMPDERRIATLLAFVRIFEKSSLSDALDVFDLLITELKSSAEKIGKKERLRTIGDLDAAALLISKAFNFILDDDCPAEQIRNKTFALASKERLQKAQEKILEVARPTDDDYHKERANLYRRVRVFLPKLLETVEFGSVPTGEKTMKAIGFLKSIQGERNVDMSQAPMDVVSTAWRRQVIDSHNIIDRNAYKICVLEKIQEDLRRRDVFVDASDRWSDPRAKLLQGELWLSVKPQVCRAVGRQDSADIELTALEQELDAAYRRTASNLPNNQEVRIETNDGRDTLTVSNLDKLEEPLSLLDLRDKVQAMLPHVELPEMLLEIHARTGFADQFTHINEYESRAEDLPISVCAVLIAEACNIGIEPIINEDIPALSRSRLLWIQQNYIRADTLTRANSNLVAEQNKIPLVQYWGGGEVASADGLRFVVPVRTINATYNPKYFGNKKGATWYELVSDQHTGLSSLVIPGTLRDSMYTLEVLLQQQTVLQPLEIMADTAAVSDVVFALYWLLGYRFSPRLADIGEARFWKMYPNADYGPLNGIARQTINKKLIVQNWEDILRVMGSLKYGTITASELIRSLLRSKRPTTLTRAIRELGRIVKTIYMLDYIDNSDYRRRILTQLNRGERRWEVARTIYFGRRGELRKRYKEGQEEQLGALGLVLNAAVLWQTTYMDRVIMLLESRGELVKAEDKARLSPLVHKNFNVLGKYTFRLPDSLARGEFRRLREPESKSEDD